MTSGVFTSFDISAIWVNRETRQRREITDVEDLAKSIAKIGLINPIVVKKDGELIAGERRWTAVQILGWTHINVQFAEDMSEIELKLLELEENVRRVDLPWQDQCRAVEEYHKLRTAEQEDWTVSATAEALGLDRREVGQKLMVAKELDNGNSRVTEAPRYTVARGIVVREAERKETSVLEKLDEVITGEKPVKKEVPIVNGSFIEWQKGYDGIKFNFIHCDFPYGVKADTHDQGAASSFGGYADGPEVYRDLLLALAASMDTAVAESAHLMFWFSMDYYQETLDTLRDMGWEVSAFPLMWHKSDNMGILPDPSRGPRRIYETCFLGSRGDRKIIRAVSNVVSSPTTKLIHMSEKPVPVLSKFMEMFVDQYTIMLDPTCGSGNAVKAAENKGANKVFGIEINQEFYKLAKENYYKEDQDEL